MYLILGNVSRGANQETKDENVFDIQQGVAIGLFRRSEVDHNPPAYWISHLHGQNEKYQHLLRHDVASEDWVPLAPKAEFYLLIPQDVQREAEYQQGWALQEIAPLFSTGIVTARNSFTILVRRRSGSNSREFARIPVNEARTNFGLGKDSNDWQVARAQADVRANIEPSIRASKILYPRLTSDEPSTQDKREALCVILDVP